MVAVVAEGAVESALRPTTGSDAAKGGEIDQPVRIIDADQLEMRSASALRCLCRY